MFINFKNQTANMQCLSIFLSLISVSEGANGRPDYLTDYNLRMEDGKTSTRIIPVHIGQKQNLVCPGDQEFFLFKVSKEDYDQCNTVRGENILHCYITTEEIPILTRAFEEMTATGWGEVHPGETEYYISPNCEIKIEIQIKLRTISNEVEREASIQNKETVDVKINNLWIVGVLALIVLLLLVGLGFGLIDIPPCTGKHRCNEREGTRNDNRTDYTYQRPCDIFA